MPGTAAKEWLEAYAERVSEIPELRPEVFGVRLEESRTGDQCAFYEIVSASLRPALDVVADLWHARPTRAVWDMVADANSAISAAVRSFFGRDWGEYQQHLRCIVRSRLRPELGPA